MDHIICDGPVHLAAAIRCIGFHGIPGDPLLAEKALRLLPASDLRSRITLLEDAARACRAELRRRPSHCQEAPQPKPVASSSSCMLLQLGHDEMGVVAHELCDPVRPLLAVNLGSTAKGLRVPMQAALAQLRQQHQEVKAFVALSGRLLLTIRSEKGAAAPIGASWYLCLKK